MRIRDSQFKKIQLDTWTKNNASVWRSAEKAILRGSFIARMERWNELTKLFRWLIERRRKERKGKKKKKRSKNKKRKKRSVLRKRRWECFLKEEEEILD